MSANVQTMTGRLALIRAGGHSTDTQVFAPPGAALLTAGAGQGAL